MAATSVELKSRTPLEALSSSEVARRNFERHFADKISVSRFLKIVTKQTQAGIEDEKLNRTLSNLQSKVCSWLADFQDPAAKKSFLDAAFACQEAVLPLLEGKKEKSERYLSTYQQLGKLRDLLREVWILSADVKEANNQNQASLQASYIIKAQEFTDHFEKFAKAHPKCEKLIYACMMVVLEQETSLPKMLYKNHGWVSFHGKHSKKDESYNASLQHKVETFEWCIFTLLLQALSSGIEERNEKRIEKSLKLLAKECEPAYHILRLKEKETGLPKAIDFLKSKYTDRIELYVRWAESR